MWGTKHATSSLSLFSKIIARPYGEDVAINKEARKKRRRGRKDLEDEIVQAEGQVYGAGIAA